VDLQYQTEPNSRAFDNYGTQGIVKIYEMLEELQQGTDNAAAEIGLSYDGGYHRWWRGSRGAEISFRV
jgi:hypothetical protein